MLEARVDPVSSLKKLLDSIKELVTDANFECNEEGINLQAMDNSHVALVAVKLYHDGFVKYRCDRPMPLGVNLASLTKVLKCAKDDDICTLKATDDGDVLNLTYEAKNSDRIAEYDMKLMDIDSDTLGIPETEYDARVVMASSEFTRIVRDLSQLGESVRIEVSKEGIRFASDGESANGSVLLKQTDAAKDRYKHVDKVKPEKKDGEEEEDEEEEGSKKKKVKKEKVKREDGDEDVEMEDDEDPEVVEKKESDEEEEDEDEEEEDFKNKKKRKAATGKKGAAEKPAKKAKKSPEDSDDKNVGGVLIEMNQHVTLTFSLKYLVNFSKSGSMSSEVSLMMSNDVPLLVSYQFETGHIRYYLAPKIGDD